MLHVESLYDTMTSQLMVLYKKKKKTA